MTGQARTAILASLILHSIAFIIFTAVKLYQEGLDVMDKMPVAFVKVQETKPRRRSNIVRPIVAISKLPQDHSQKQAVIRPAYDSSEVFYTDAPRQVFSMVGSVERKGSDVRIVAQPPSIKRPQRILNPIGVTVLKETYLPEMRIQTSVTGGRDFLKEAAPIQAKPSLSDILQRFAQIVRRKIESKKIYPLAARRSMIEGRVGVKITILNDGQLEKVEIIESSGYEILDKAALKSVRSSIPFPPVPEEAKRERIQMSIYLIFKMT